MFVRCRVASRGSIRAKTYQLRITQCQEPLIRVVSCLLCTVMLNGDDDDDAEGTPQQKSVKRLS